MHVWKFIIASMLIYVWRHVINFVVTWSKPISKLHVFFKTNKYANIEIVSGAVSSGLWPCVFR